MEAWRERGQAIRIHTVSHLDYYLNQFSENVSKVGGHVHSLLIYRLLADSFARKLTLDISIQMKIKEKGKPDRKTGTQNHGSKSDDAMTAGLPSKQSSTVFTGMCFFAFGRINDNSNGKRGIESKEPDLWRGLCHE